MSSSKLSSTKALAMPKKKRATAKPDWTWEDEMLMYDVSQRDMAKKRLRLEKESLTQEMRRIKKEKELETLYMREERKLFLGGLSHDTVRQL